MFLERKIDVIKVVRVENNVYFLNYMHERAKGKNI
jgi:hypothetical protein